MRKLIATSIIVASLAAGSAAFAAPPPKAAQAQTGKAANTSTQAPAHAPMGKAKREDCAKQWKAQKHHSQTRKAFLAACEKS